MALKPDRNILFDNIEYFVTAAAERGGVVSQTAAGSSGVTGAGLDNSRRVVSYVANPSGGTKPIGMLMWDAVNVDLSRQQVNKYKSEFQIGGKAFLMKKGTATTNMFLPQALPSGGANYPQTLYVGGAGLLGVGSALAGSGYPVVGQVMTALDTEGYAEVYIDL